MDLTNRKGIRALLLLTPLLLTACSGGGGDDSGVVNGTSAGTPTTRFSNGPSSNSPSPNSPSTNSPVVTRAYAYVAEEHTSTVSGYSVDMTTGELAELGTVYARSLPKTVTVHPDGKFVYVTNEFENGVSAYRIDPDTGALTLLGVTQHPGANLGTNVAVDASGRFLYVTLNYALDFNPSPSAPPQVPQEIATYDIDPDTGELTLASTLEIGEHMNRIVVPPGGNVAYVLTSIGKLSAYAIDPASGSLTLMAETVLADTPVGGQRLGVHPGGTYAYIASSSTGETSEVRTYKFDPATRTLTQVGQPVPSGFDPVSVAAHPGGNFAYVGNQLSYDVWIYRIDVATGALIPAAAPVSTDDKPTPNIVVFDPSGKFAYVGGAGNIQAFSVDPLTGALTPVGTPVSRSQWLKSLAIAGIN